MFPSKDRSLTKAVLGIFFVLVLAYAFFEAQGILFGPTIDTFSQLALMHQPLVTIAGRASRISSLLMNGEPVPVTPSGAFSVPYLLAPGYNRIVLEAKDSYGHASMKVIEVMYQPLATSSAASATSTAAASTPASSTPAIAH